MYKILNFIGLLLRNYGKILTFVADIIDGEGKYEELKQEFLDDLKEFCREEGLIFNRRKYSDMIDKFVAYYTIDEI